MVWFLIIVLTVALLLALLAVILLTTDATSTEQLEQAHLEAEVRRAERRLHDIAGQSFEAMLIEARSRDRAS
ncbi:MAG TPA: hypothetical protein VGT98_07095 [Candidatus Elarobacter sp.]|nr:hypothetical protein [Candidatus Elarobacter sp.]